MKLILKTLAPLALISATVPAVATNNTTQVQHVIIVIQENRTPESLFNQDTALQSNAHVQPTNNQGLCNDPKNPTITLQGVDLFTCYDPDHSHQPSWNAMWDSGGMDGACRIRVVTSANNGTPWCTTAPACATTDGSKWDQSCSYTYVLNTAGTNHWGTNYKTLDPYFTLAQQYGFANYMFATNQGPSFPAHQFLFSGTSAPVDYDDPNQNCLKEYPNNQCWQWFAAENAKIAQGDPYGCVAKQDATAYLIDLGFAETYDYEPSSPVQSVGFPCYTHPSLPTLLDRANLSWAYYLRELNGSGSNLWNAPVANNDICDTSGFGPKGTCNTNPTSEYYIHVYSKLPGGANYQGNYAPILTDIENCALPAVSWVIPDGNWSDHAGGNPSLANGDGGPSWVANIVNAVGNSKNNGCGIDYWGYQTPSNETAEPTVILVVWDDWGGYYDDVVPPDCAGPGQCTGYYGGQGGNGQQYVYGFRVPLLVIGAYANQGYVSGSGIKPPITCPNYYCHDFGSILNFIEYAFGLQQGGIASNSNWPYADAFVMDTNPPDYPYSLYDFFNFTQQPHAFQTIQNLEYPETCFHTPKQTGCFPNYPDDPDGDAAESGSD